MEKVAPRVRESAVVGEGECSGDVDDGGAGEVDGERVRRVAKFRRVAVGATCERDSRRREWGQKRKLAKFYSVRKVGLKTPTVLHIRTEGVRSNSVVSFRG